MTTFKTKIWVTFTATGFHSWPGAPEENISYLRDVHRHKFYFKISIDVPHPDRALEFHTVRDNIMERHIDLFYQKQGFVETAFDYKNMSCEMIAEKLLQDLIMEYPDRTIEVDVSEDGENGGTALYTVDETK
jgi:hypothetical protein